MYEFLSDWWWLFLLLVVLWWQMPGDEAETPPAEAPRRLAADEKADVLALLRGGQKIAAIKRYRELTGAGLKAAKEAVEAMER